jgi:tetratricopeptide (TPR) repeat protein
MAIDVRNERDQLRQLEHIFTERDFARALVLAEQVLHEYPQSFPGRLQYARVLKELNRLEEAGRLLADLDIQFGGNLNVLVELADLYFRQKRYVESRDVFQRVLFLDSYNRRAKATLAYIERLLADPASDRMEDTSVEMRVPTSALEPPVATPPPPAGAASPLEEILLDRGRVIPPVTEKDAPVSIDLDSGRIDLARRPTLPEDELDSMFASLEAPEDAPVGPRSPTLPEEDLDVMFAAPEFLPEAEPIVEASPAPVEPAEPAPPELHTAASESVASLTFDTASAADLYFQQGLYSEAEAIYAKLFKQTGRDEYEMRIEEIARLRKTEWALHIIERLLAFQQALQKVGNNRV